MNLKNIIFDFGGIIVDLDKQAAVDAFAALGCRVADSIGTYAQKGVFAALETGQMPEAEFFAFVRRQAGHDIPEADIRRAWNSMLVAIPSRRLEVIRALRPRYRTFMLSNTNALHWDYVCHGLQAPDGVGLEDCFERMFLSFRMGLAKPDAEIFRVAMAEASLVPAETLFVDDSEENCRVAESLGMHVFHSRRPDDWLNLWGKEAAE